MHALSGLTEAAYSRTKTTHGVLRGDSETVDNNREEHGEGMKCLKWLLL